MQVKILRLLQEKNFTPLGATEELCADVRLVLATNKNLEKEVMDGRFREDLFYRINVISIPLPSLRERPEDIPLLAHYFLENYSRLLEKKINKLSSYALKILSQYQFSRKCQGVGKHHRAIRGHGAVHHRVARKPGPGRLQGSDGLDQGARPR